MSIYEWDGDCDVFDDDGSAQDSDNYGSEQDYEGDGCILNAAGTPLLQDFDGDGSAQYSDNEDFSQDYDDDGLVLNSAGTPLLQDFDGDGSTQYSDYVDFSRNYEDDGSILSSAGSPFLQDFNNDVFTEGFHYDMSNDGDDDDDDDDDGEDDARRTKVRNYILGKNDSSVCNVPRTNTSVDYSIRLAMSSKLETSTSSDSSNPLIDDSLRMYLTAPELVRRTNGENKDCLSIDPTVDESESTAQSQLELFVGNIPYKAKAEELQDWFISSGHDVTHVDLQMDKKNAHYAFVRFDSSATARDVLYKSETNPSQFIFQGNKLLIKHSERSSEKSDTNIDTTNVINDLYKSTKISVEITDIYYGMLITEAAMRNHRRTTTSVSSNDTLGVVAHHLMDDDDDLEISFSLSIDTKKKELVIVGTFNVHEDYMSDTSTTVQFQWTFQDLKARKITPVLINQTDIYLLLEIKRPPIIVEIKDSTFGRYNTFDETRLPANVHIGHANAWLFKLSSQDVISDYKNLFGILHRHNLTPRQFSGDMIVHLMRSNEAMRRNFRSIQLISNNQWIKDNQGKVNEFFNRRWPSYPFETKFEIMKLISKHVITVNDLIIDEQVEDILKACTMNAFVALTDHIIDVVGDGFDDENEDWVAESEQDDKSSSEEVVPIIVSDVINFSDLRTTAAGTRINNVNGKVTESRAMTMRSSKHHLGTFTRLLLNAHEELLRKHQLCILESSGVHATRLELRTPSAHSFLMRKIYITPSTVFYEGPYLEEKCAVTRHYEEHQDRFLRVTFRDEDYRVLHDYNDRMSIIYERIKEILYTGVNICDRNYQFLAFSSSQLREHSCWMFAAPNQSTTVDNIRQWMGDFSDVHPVAKYAARLGQLFSSSIKGLKLQNDQFKEIEDDEKIEMINGNSRKHCFTDGIGIISKRLAKQLAKEIKQSDGESYPSAFQIRCGGYKGMVCIDVFNRIKEPNVDVYFRPSMNKFVAKNISIDVVRTSYNPSAAFLNRQIILLLSSLGIPNENFLHLQNEMLEQLSLLTKNSQEAIQALKYLNEYGGNGFHTFLVAYLRRLGKFKDPFVWRLLHVFRAFLLKELRTKTKIRVQDSWSLFGVIDESGSLQHGQVFIQIDTTHQQKENPTKEIFQGPVIVTRNPCFHPGDIRKLKAVDLPGFHHLKNVIVFPKQGPRPHPEEMSGGDLDGDTFWISRHPKLIFRKNEQPFDYQGQQDEVKQTQSSSTTKHTIKDVCNFFGEYIAADNLGLIANCHLVLADQLEQGAMNDKCLKLARMHSMAVDFAKSGVSAPRLTKEFRSREYPSYMEKKDKPACESKTVLGALYDQVKVNPIDFYIDEIEEIQITSTFPYEIFFVDGNSSYMPEARVIKYDYDRDVKRIMRQYGIRHEVEFVSGYILKLTSKQYLRETKLFDLRNEIRHAYRILQMKYLHLFWQEFYQNEEDDQSKWSTISEKLTWKNQLDLFELHHTTPPYEEIDKKASAWFRVTYEPWMGYMKRKQTKAGSTHEHEGTQDRYRGLFSFAWLVYPVLLKIFQEREDTLNNDRSLKRKHIQETNTKSNKKTMFKNSIQ